MLRTNKNSQNGKMSKNKCGLTTQHSFGHCHFTQVNHRIQQPFLKSFIEDPTPT
jgi:hypothetical protein